MSNAEISLLQIKERFCIPNFGMIFDCAYPKKLRSENGIFSVLHSENLIRLRFQGLPCKKMESVEFAKAPKPKTFCIRILQIINSVLNRAGPTAAACTCVISDGLPGDTSKISYFASEEARTFDFSSDPTEPRTKGVSTK